MSTGLRKRRRLTRLFWRYYRDKIRMGTLLVPIENLDTRGFGN